MNRRIPFSEETLQGLQDLVDEYPYFQTAQLLYALNLQARKDIRFPVELKKAACHAGDRRKLFYLTEEESFPPELIEKLEKEKDNHASFDLIDYFLVEKEKTEKDKNARASVASTDYLSYAFSEKTQDEGEKIQPMQHQQAIDKFLEADKKLPIQIKWKEKAKESEKISSTPGSNEDENFFSVTLAKIYLKQKKYERALEIIRKLNLLYPEKNLYFADQIRFLEKLIINTKK
jgi:tetratricopeptide (TPR) repeat protein